MSTAQYTSPRDASPKPLTSWNRGQAAEKQVRAWLQGRFLVDQWAGIQLGTGHWNHASTDYGLGWIVYLQNGPDRPYYCRRAGVVHAGGTVGLCLVCNDGTWFAIPMCWRPYCLAPAQPTALPPDLQGILNAEARSRGGRK